MDELQLSEKYKEFEKKIEKFRENPKDYQYKVKNFQIRALQNALASFLFWLLIAVILNAIAISYFFEAEDKADFSSLASIIFLFLAILVRSTCANFFLYRVLGNLGKFYQLHQFINRIGYFHRYMATSTLIWLFIFLNYKEFKAPYIDEILVVILGAFLTLIIFTASSLFRRRNHNIFENIHRYIGYLSFLLLTAYLFISSINDNTSIETLLLKPHFIFIFLILLLLISPWLGVKRVKPELVHVGAHVIGIKIKGKPSFGTYSSITLANGNFHPFGDSMYDFDDMENRTLYITPSGDRTTQIVDAANKGKFLLKSCTLKKHRKYGFMYHHAIYDKILIVVTGGGIAPIIPCLVLNKHTKIVVLWLCHSPIKEFTSQLLTKLTDKISQQDIYFHILDTDEEDLKSFNTKTYTSLILKAYNHYKPESIFVMSNQKFTINVMHSLRENRIKAYGANFDS